jgi:hypothetical protein
LHCFNNALPLSDLKAASEKISDVNNKYLGTQTLAPVNVALNKAVCVDNAFSGSGTDFTVSKNGDTAIPGTDYSIVVDSIKFLTAGTYVVEISNPAITSHADYPAKVVATFVASGTGYPVTGVTLNPTTVTLAVGETVTLRETVLPANATVKTVTWSSSNTSVATVDTSGVVIAASVGVTSITVMTVDGGKTAACTVIVNNAALPGSGSGIVNGSINNIRMETFEILYVYLYAIPATKAATPDGYELVAVTTVDANGHYSFNNLPEGTYKVLVDIPDYETQPSPEIKIAQGQQVANVNFSVDENSHTVTAELLPTGVADVETWHAASLYPNPFTGSVHLTGAEGSVLQVITANGTVVHTQKVVNPDETINLEKLPAGMYLFRLEKDGKAKTIKAVKVDN